MIKAKKMLSIVIAFMLIFNVFAVFSTAAVDSDYALAIRLSTDKASYAAGDNVIVSVKMEGSERGGYDLTTIAGGNLPFGWNNNVLSFASTDINEQIIPSHMNLDMASTGIKADAGYVTFDDTETNTYGWNEAMDFGLILNDDGSVYDSEKEAFTVSLKIADDAAPGTYYYGIVPSAMSNATEDYYYSLFAPDLGDGLFNNCYEGDFGVENCYDLTQAIVAITVEEAVAGPEVVALDDTMARMDNWPAAETTNTFDGGLIGQINNAALTFTDGECNEIESIEVYANGQKMGNAYQVYKVNDTTYQFRAVILNMDKTADTYATDVEYEFKVTMKGTYADSGVLTATKTVSAQTIFTEAYDNYKAANA